MKSSAEARLAKVKLPLGRGGQREFRGRVRRIHVPFAVCGIRMEAVADDPPVL